MQEQFLAFLDVSRAERSLGDLLQSSVKGGSLSPVELNGEAQGGMGVTLPTVVARSALFDIELLLANSAIRSGTA